MSRKLSASINRVTLASLREHLKTWSENEVRTTKEIAQSLAVSVKAAYAACKLAEKEYLLSRYGYAVKGGWEDADNSGRRSQSLGWQINS